VSTGASSRCIPAEAAHQLLVQRFAAGRSPSRSTVWIADRVQDSKRGHLFQLPDFPGRSFRPAPCARP
jgi:hypothetical protein